MPFPKVEAASLPDLKVLLFLKLEAIPFAIPFYDGSLPGFAAHEMPLPLPLSASTRSLSIVLLSLFTWTTLNFHVVFKDC